MVNELREHLAAYADGRGILLGVAGETDGWRSVIVIGVGVRGGAAAGDEPRGVIAAALSGADYHVTVRHELSLLEAFLTTVAPPFDSYAQVDDGRLKERPLAVRAGIAYPCRSQCVCSDRFGTYFNIGLLATTLDLPADAPDTRQCLNCGACVTACPGGALDNGFTREKCVSRITQKKGALTDEERRAIGDRLWGCDICQAVCPLNAGKIVLGDAPALDAIDALDEATFSARYPALTWRGLATLKRNAQSIRENPR